VAEDLTGRGLQSLDWVDGDPAALRPAYVRMRGERRRLAERWQVAGAPWGVRLLEHPPGRRRGGRPGSTAILYFHGGGWFVGSPVTHAAIARQLASETGLAVLSIDYRLLPGHSAHAPIRDGVAALSALAARADYRRVVLAGDSAGAAVACGVARFATGRARRCLLGVVAFYGAFGLLHSPSIEAFGRRADGLDEASLAALYRRLTALTGSHPYRIAVLAGRRLPPTHLFVGDRDPLLEDTLAFHARLRATAPVQLTVVPGEGHGFLHQVAGSAMARQTVRLAAASIARWVGRDARP